jgi:ADP-ribose pyrophosphatase YjhB (NUDIX family)
MKRPLRVKIKNFAYRILKGKTVGVRALIVKGEKTLLVKHSYRPLWYMPGGGVDFKETGLQAVKRELQEEVNINCDKFELFGFYHSEQ